MSNWLFGHYITLKTLLGKKIEHCVTSNSKRHTTSFSVYIVSIFGFFKARIFFFQGDSKFLLGSIHYIFYLMPYGILCHCGNYSNDTSHE